MLKKLLSILCIISVALLSNCMNEIEDKENKQLAKLDRLINIGNEEKIVKWLDKHPPLVSNNMSYILDSTSRKFLHKVVAYLKDFMIDEKDLIICALNLEDIEEVKRLTSLDEYTFDEDEGLDFREFKSHLANLGVVYIIDDIIALWGKNYKDRSGNRYLQFLIRNDPNSRAVRNFIKKAQPEALNAQESDTGSTALHEAAIAWKRSTLDIAKQQQLEYIIEQLLKHGANPEAANRQGNKFSDFEVFDQNPYCWNKLRNNYLEEAAKPIRPRQLSSKTKRLYPEVNRKSKNSNLKLFATLAGLSLAGVAVFYFGYKFFGKKSINTTVRLKR